MSIVKRAIIGGVLGSLLLSGFYLTIMLLTMPTLLVAWENFRSFWYLITLIIISFGWQVGLWLYLKFSQQINRQGAIPVVSGTTSGLSMVVCCLHHLIDFLPILGLASTAIFLTRYQKPLLILGLVINLLGLAYLLDVYNKKRNKQKFSNCH